MIAVLISVSSFAQVPSARSLRVINQTNCHQFFAVFGDEFCQCGSTYSSNIIGIAPGSMLFYPDTTTLGGSFPVGAPKGISLARIVNQQPPFNCPAEGGTIGQPLCGVPPSVTFLTYQTGCVPCANTTAAWYPATTSCNQEARLVFS